MYVCMYVCVCIHVCMYTSVYVYIQCVRRFYDAGVANVLLLCCAGVANVLLTCIYAAQNHGNYIGHIWDIYIHIYIHVLRCIYIC
jgi:hypothetical protein